MLALCTLLAAALIQSCDAYPNGPPPAACSHMTPGHGDITAQDQPSPFEIIVSNTCFSSVDILTVVLRARAGGSADMKGFFIQATSPDTPGQNYGQFDLREWSETHDEFLQTIDCFDERRSAVSHYNPDADHAWTERTVDWQSPRNFHGQYIQFNATIVQNYITFWTHVISQPVMYNESCVQFRGTDYPPCCSATRINAVFIALLIAAAFVWNIQRI